MMQVKSPVFVAPPYLAGRRAGVLRKGTPAASTAVQQHRQHSRPALAPWAHEALPQPSAQQQAPALPSSTLGTLFLSLLTLSVFCAPWDTRVDHPG